MVGFGGGLPSGGKEAAEKGMLSDKMTEEHPAGAKQVAEKVGISDGIGETRSSGAEARADFVGLMRGLKTPASLRIEFFRSL